MSLQHNGGDDDENDAINNNNNNNRDSSCSSTHNNNNNYTNACGLRWGQAPVFVLGHIYEYLDQGDRLNASQTCHHWRQVLFQKRFFHNFKLQLDVDNDRQCAFFRHTLGQLTSEVTIVFDFLNAFHIDKIRRILYRIARSDNVQGLRFQTNNVGATAPGDMSDDQQLVDIEQCFVSPLKLILGRKGAACRILDFGAIEALTYYGLDFLKTLSRPHELSELTLASIKYNPSHYPIFSMENTLLQRCTSLQVLSLDYDCVNESVLATLHSLPLLRKLIICIHGLDREHPGVGEEAWAQFAARFPCIDLILTLVYAYEAVEVLQVRVLRRNMPITRLRVLFCDFMNADALEWMSMNNNTTLRSIQWIDAAFKHSTKNVMDLFLRSGQDPFVMMSWLCKQLEEIVIHGYVLDPHNIVGISRLRGRLLKRLEVSLVDSMPGGKACGMDAFIEEINSLLGQKWAPLKPKDMHPALGYAPVSDDVRDEFVFELLRQDIASN